MRKKRDLVKTSPASSQEMEMCGGGSVREHEILCWNCGKRFLISLPQERNFWKHALHTLEQSRLCCNSPLYLWLTKRLKDLLVKQGKQVVTEAITISRKKILIKPQHTAENPPKISDLSNLCHCYLWVYGSRSELERFREIAKNGIALDANRFVPYPEDFWKDDYNSEKLFDLFKIRIPDGYLNGGHYWCLQRWGVSHPPLDVSVKPRRNYLLYSFKTPLGPPAQLIRAASVMFPKLLLIMRYYNSDLGFQGLFVAKDGQVLIDEDWEYRTKR